MMNYDEAVKFLTDAGCDRYTAITTLAGCCWTGAHMKIKLNGCRSYISIDAHYRGEHRPNMDYWGHGKDQYLFHIFEV